MLLQKLPVFILWLLSTLSLFSQEHTNISPSIRPALTKLSQAEIKLNDLSTTCKTNTFKMKLSPDGGEKIDLVSFIYLPTNNLLILSNSEGENGEKNGWFTVLQADGTIIVHQKLLLEGNISTELYGGNCNLRGEVTIIGKVSGQSNQSFLVRIGSKDFTPIWIRKLAHSNPLEEIAIGSHLDTLVTFACRSGNKVELGMVNNKGELQWSRTFIHPSIRNLVGIQGNHSGHKHITMALNVVENNKSKILLVNHESENGNLGGAYLIRSQDEEVYSATEIKTFNDKIILCGIIFNSASNKSNLFRYIFYDSRELETIHNYTSIPSLQAGSQLKMSVAGEWLSWISENSKDLSFIKHAANYQIAPEKGGRIDIKGAKEVKAVAGTNDGGYIMGINLIDKSGIFLVKTDSIGRIAACNTSHFNPEFTEEKQYKNTLTAVSISPFQTSSNSVNFSLIEENANTIFECRGLYCPTKPELDTCSDSFYKTYRSNSYLSSFGISFKIGNEIAIITSRLNQLYGTMNKVSEVLKLYNQHGQFVKGAVYLYKGEPIDIVSAFPLNQNQFLAIFDPITASNDSIQQLIVLVDSELTPKWTRWISTPTPSPFYSGGSTFADATIDEDGNIYLIGTTLGFMEKPRVTIHKFNKEGVSIWTSSIEVDNTNLAGGKIRVNGNDLIILAEGNFKGSISLRVNKSTGDPINAFLLKKRQNAGFAISLFERIDDKFIFAGKEGDNNFFAAIFDNTGYPIKMKIFEQEIISNTVAVNNSHLVANLNYFNGNEVKQVLLKTDTALNLKFANEFELDRNRRATGLHLGMKGEVYEFGNFYFGGVNNYYSNPYLRKYSEAGNLGTCSLQRMQNEFSEITPLVEKIVPVRVSQPLSNYPGIAISVAQDSEAEQVAEILCNSPINCSSLRLEGEATICDTSNSYLFEAIVNNGCQLKPNWFFDSTQVIFNTQDQKLIKLKFMHPGRHLLKASINTGCKILFDSIWIYVQGKDEQISLGSDTTLCPGDSLLLQAGPGFSSYKWNTGDTIAAIWVSSPGKYEVSVSNSCGTSLKDTIEIFIPPVPLLSVGGDSAVCIGEKFERLASTGFTSYQWKNVSNQQIVSNTSLLSVNALANTRFALKASTAIGCTRYDTLEFQVLAARTFDLGMNKSICLGDTVTFSAPTHYTAYQWNTGGISASIKAFEVGEYMLTVTDTNGCKTSDSVRILAVWPLPKPDLGADKMVCAGSNLFLNPGNFARYLWHDGSIEPRFSASTNGNYAVKVWDGNGCTASDTMAILTQLPLPESFLKPIDSLCQYEKLNLSSIGVFKSYAWSTGSNQSSIDIEKPGIYVLTVTDNNNCVGKDTIRVVQKFCQEGVFIPTAFTPNGDNLNDVFRPLVFGLVKTYEFSVFNRYGERVFHTTEPGIGWDGKWKGLPQAANNYAWICTYHLEGGTLNVERGMVMLTR